MKVMALQYYRSTLPVRVAGLALGYALFAILGLFLLDVPHELVELWPAAGLATAVLLGGGLRLWPGIPIGFLLVDGIDRVLQLDPTLPAPLLAPPLVGAAAATLQACLAVYMIERRFGRDPVRLNAVRDWIEFGVYAGPLSCAAAAGLGGLGLYLGGVDTQAPLSQVMLEWWLGGMLGVLLVLPVLLTWPTVQRRGLRWQGHPLPRLNQIAALAATVGLILTVSLAHVITSTDVAKNRKLFLGAVDRGGGHLLHEYVSLKAVLNAAALDISHVPENPMFGLSRLRNPEPVYQLGGMDGFGLIAPSGAAATRQGGPGRSALEVRYFEPLPEGTHLRGLKLQLDKSVEAAAAQAFETGRAAIARVTLSAPGLPSSRQIILLQPAFHHNLPGDTPQARRNALIGWTFLLVAPEQIFGRDVEKEAEGAYLSSVDYSFLNGSKTGFKTVFASAPAERPPHFRLSETFDAFGRTWRFHWQSTAWFEAAIADRTGVLVLYGGLLLTALATGLVQVLSDREQKISEAEQRWLRAMEGSQIGVFDVDLVNWKGITSDYWNRMVGVSEPAAALDPEAAWRARIHPDDRPGLEKAQADLLSGRSGRLLHEYRLQSPDGSWHWMRDSAQIVDRDEDGAPLRLLGTMSDITPLKAALDLAEKREQELSSLIENAPVAMSVLERDSTFQIVNDAFCAFVGFPKEALVGFKARELPRIRDIRDFDTQLRALWNEAEQSFTSELRYVRPDGAEVFGIVTASRLRSGRGEEAKIIFQVVDITERRRLEKLKGDFVATVSHELRTPLTSISGSIALILGTMADELPDKAHHMLDIAQNNAKRLGSLVNDLLDMQKLASGTITLETVKTDVGAVMREAVSETDAYAKRFGVNYALSLPDDPLTAEIDPNRFKQVMANLMSNAAKFSPEGGQIEIELERGAEGARRYARVSVTDHGRGIPPEFRSRIFRPFSQAASSSTRDREGTGLGLVISKEIVEKMGGTIGFESEPDVRTTFWFRFPIAADA